MATNYMQLRNEGKMSKIANNITQGEGTMLCGGEWVEIKEREIPRYSKRFRVERGSDRQGSIEDTKGDTRVFTSGY